VRKMSEERELTEAQQVMFEAWEVNEILQQLINKAMFTDMSSEDIVECLKRLIKRTSPPIQGLMSRMLGLIHIATTKALLEEKYGKVN